MTKEKGKNQINFETKWKYDAAPESADHFDILEQYQLFII